VCSLTWKSNAKPIRVPILYWKMPSFSNREVWFTSVRDVALDFFTIYVCWRKENFRVHTFVVHKACKVVVHDGAAVPTIEESGSKKLKLLMVSNLVVRHDNGTTSRPMRLVFKMCIIDVGSLAAYLISDAGQQPKIIIKTTLRHQVELVIFLQPMLKV